MNLLLALALTIGFVAGLRAMTAPAVIAWAAHLGWLHLEDSFLAFTGSTTAVAIFTLLAIGELVADKLPTTPKRTSLAPLLARILTGALCGMCLAASSNQSLVIGAACGGIGAVIGAFFGYEMRKSLVTHLHLKDFFVAAGEDLIAVGLALFLVSR